MVYHFVGHSRLGIRPNIGIGIFRTYTSRAAKQISEKQSVHSQVDLEHGSKPTDLPQGVPREGNAMDAKTLKASSYFPKFMRNYAKRISHAPVSHITAFLIVHELSAVIPLFGIWGAFYYFDYAPLGIFPEAILDKGTQFIRRMAERNDWQMLANAERGSHLLLQGAASYGIVKALMPLRLVFSLWAMPWFARWFVVPVSSRLAAVTSRVLKRRQK